MPQRDLIELRPEGLYCAAGGFHIDPWQPVPLALITHAHGDHARWGSQRYLGTTEARPLLRAIRRLGFVQADPIRAPARAQDLILRHRVADYRAGDIQRHPFAGRQIFQQDPMLLLQRTGAETRRAGGNAGGLLPRSKARKRPLSGEVT